MIHRIATEPNTLLTLTELDPNDLILPLDGNVRIDTQLDKDFLASVKNRGIVVPVLVTPNTDGGHDVLDGQRRVLAALAAGHTMIPAIITHEREAAERVIDQLIVNDHRAALTEVEHTGAFKTLALFGMAATQISRRTSTPIARVGDSIKVANNETAAHALANYSIDLTQAVVIADFSTDKKATKELIQTAETRPDQFNHVAAKLRTKRELAAHRDALADQIAADGFTRLADLASWGRTTEGDYTLIAKLAKPDTPQVELTVDDIRSNPDAAAAIRQTYDTSAAGYRDWAEVNYYLKNHVQHGFIDIQDAPGPERTPEQIAAAEAHERAIAESRAARAARDAAAAVRRAFISELLERPTPPADATTFIAWALTYDGNFYHTYNGIPELVMDWLGLDAPQKETATVVRGALARRPKLALTFTFALALHNMEIYTADFNPDYPRPEHAGPIKLHLEQLRAWGYGLSDAEQSILSTIVIDETIPEPDADDE